MKKLDNVAVMKAYVSETATCGDKPTYEALVQYAKEIGISGATVTKAVMGYGSHKTTHTAKILRLAEDMPIVVELVDSKENLEALSPWLDENLTEGLVIITGAEVIYHKTAV